jgi:hypothetical protein
VLDCAAGVTEPYVYEDVFDMDQLFWLLYCVRLVWGLCELLLLRLGVGGLMLSLTPEDEVR